MPARSMQALFPWLPSNLANMLADLWAEHGDMNVALGHLRQTPQHRQAFPGIRRDDGSLRMDEQAYHAHREAFRREFVQWGLNPKVFEGHHVEMIEGEVSIDEFRQRLGSKIQGIQRNLPQVREAFGRFFGVDAMDDTALIGAALDPQVGLDLLQGRITAAQIAGEAAVQGFMRSRERAETLAFAGGLDQMRARELFSQAGRAVPRFDRMAERFRDGGFGVEQFEDAAVFGDAQQQRRMGRLQASEEALFRQGGQVRRDETGLTGLRRR